MLKNRFQNFRGRGFAALAALALAGACGNTKATGGGSGGDWTYLPPGSDTGGKGGAASGGVSGHAGVAGAGGDVVLPPLTFQCAGTKPNQPKITSFDGFMGELWNSPGNVDGGIYVYPDDLKASAGEFLGLEAQVSIYTGIGLYFNGCVDASSYTGVRFTISGDVGASGSVRFFPVVNRNRDVSTEFSVGACVPDDAGDPWPSCHPPEVSLPVTSVPTVHSVPWSAFKNGVPTATTDGSDVLTLEWAFRWEAGQNYAGQVKIDDVSFYTDDGEGGAGGGGGAGGASDTGHDGGAPANPGSGGQAGN